MTVSFFAPTKVKETQAGYASPEDGACVASRAVDALMRRAIEAGASAIHIETRGKETHARYRVAGILRTLFTLPRYLHSSLVDRIKLLASMRLGETRAPQQGRIALDVDGRSVDFHVSTLPVFDQEKIVMRLREISTGTSRFIDLGFRGRERALIAQKLQQPQGIILVTGPVGSGKSTTIRALLGAIGHQDGIAATLEDPLSSFLPGVTQTQIRPEDGFGFANGLRALLRQDARVIMMEEIPDAETGSLAVHAALTGHLILAAVHADDATGALMKLLDLGIEPFLLSSTLQAVLSQRLVRKICEQCSAPAEASGTHERLMRARLAGISANYYPPEIAPDGALTFRKGVGCQHCDDTGYVGRVGVAELNKMTPEVEELLHKRCTAEQLRSALKRQAWLTVEQDAAVKALEGVTTVEEALRVAGT